MLFRSKRGFGRNNPYCTGVVTLDEGLRISALIKGVDPRRPQEISTGARVMLDLTDLDPEKPSVTFRPV